MEMRRLTKFVAGVGAVAAAGSAFAQPVTFYSDPGLFASTMLSGGKVLKGTETFEAARVAASAITTTNSPLNAATNDQVFQPGEIEPNLEVRTSSGREIAVLGAGTAGVPTKVVGANFFEDSTDLLFDDPNKCGVGLDVFEVIASQGVEVRVYSAANVLLGSTSVASSAGGIFLGIAANQAIGRINLAGVGNGGELVDNIEMWNANPVPEPFTMILGAAGLTAAAIRRRRKA